MSDKGSGFRNWFITTVEAMRPPGEEKKRRREIVAVFFLSLLFVFLTWFEIRLFSSSQSLPFTHSIFFFGLVNINIIILLLLLFLIFRNVVKVSIERREGLFGAGLKSRLTVAFVAFSVVPTFLMFMISVFYIHTSFDKWFSVKTMGILKSSLEVQNAYYFNAKRKNFHYAHQIADSLAKVRSPERILRVLESKRQELALDVVEYYPS
ncbi:MAG: PAS domain-containing sensor histidine kinase, partial [Bdellovibrionaceae bacterium]|nr:PAS domain-containing sensor histidine kinase [Pseudobdellovibrionaceae bacterium]